MFRSFEEFCLTVLCAVYFLNRCFRYLDDVLSASSHLAVIFLLSANTSFFTYEFLLLDEISGFS